MQRERADECGFGVWDTSCTVAFAELPEKVRLVMELQRAVLPLIARRRPLRSWERPWE
jgi:hypothetical protein